jgi:hypothetical protein
LDDELKKIGVALAQEAPHNINNIILQLNQIIAGTHMAVPIQDPEVKKKNQRKACAEKRPIDFDQKERIGIRDC